MGKYIMCLLQCVLKASYLEEEAFFECGIYTLS